MKYKAWKYFGLLWLGLALALRILLYLSPKALETLWFSGAFPIIQRAQFMVSPVLVIPGYSAMAALLITWLIWRWPRPISKSALWKRFGLRLANLAGGVAASFLMLWGFNYLDRGMAARMELVKSEAPELLADAYLDAMKRAMLHRQTIPHIEDFSSIEDYQNRPDARAIEGWVRDVLAPLGYPTETSVRVNHIRPKGLLHRLGISGIYNPWTGEANVEGALGPLTGTFTTAHELAHAFGVTSEGEANFTAYLACLNADDPLANYAAEYALWRSLGREVHRAYNPEQVAALASAIPAELLKDRQAIWENANQHKAYFPEVSHTLNDTYLKLQGVEAGIADYNEFAALYFAFTRRATKK